MFIYFCFSSFFNLDKQSTGELQRSASTSSMDNIVSNESVCAIQFSESFTYKNGLFLFDK